MHRVFFKESALNQAMGGIQSRENIWPDIKRAFIKVNANRNEEDGVQEQAFLNVLQTRSPTQQLQPRSHLKQKPGSQTQVTPAHHTSGFSKPCRTGQTCTGAG